MFPLVHQPRVTMGACNKVLDNAAWGHFPLIELVVIVAATCSGTAAVLELGKDASHQHLVRVSLVCTVDVLRY